MGRFTGVAKKGFAVQALGLGIGCGLGADVVDMHVLNAGRRDGAIPKRAHGPIGEGFPLVGMEQGQALDRLMQSAGGIDRGLQVIGHRYLEPVPGLLLLEEDPVFVDVGIADFQHVADALAGTVVALNNGRTAGLQAAYATGTAAQPGGYRDRLMSEAQSFGIDLQAVAGLVGVNVKGVDPEHSRASEMSGLRRDILEVKRRLRQRLADQSLSEAQRQSAIGDHTEEIRKRVQKLNEAEKNAVVPDFARPAAGLQSRLR